MRRISAILLVATTTLGCGGSAQNGMMKRADLQLGDKQYDHALADYRKAIDLERAKGHGPTGDMRDGQKAAAIGLADQQMKAAIASIDGRDYQNAYKQLWQLHRVGAWGIASIDAQVVKHMGDVAAHLWEPIERNVARRRFLAAVLDADLLVAPLPANHPYRLRLLQIKRAAAEFHQGRLDATLKWPAAAAFHVGMIQLFGGHPSEAGAQAAAGFQAHLATRTAKEAYQKARYAFALGRVNMAENDLIVAGIASAEPGTENYVWSGEAESMFGLNYGVTTTQIADIINQRLTKVVATAPDVPHLPDPDQPLVGYSSHASSNHSPFKWEYQQQFMRGGAIGPAIEANFQVTQSPMKPVKTADGISFALRLPGGKSFDSSSSATEYYFYYGTTSFGGQTGGWGGSLLFLSAGSASVYGYGFGYATQSYSDVIGATPTTKLSGKSNSLYVPLLYRKPLLGFLLFDLEAQVNILQLAGSTGKAGDTQHFSPLIARLQFPLYGRIYLQALGSFVYKAEREWNGGGLIGWRYADK